MNVLITDQSVPFAAALADALQGRSFSVALAAVVTDADPKAKPDSKHKDDPRPAGVAHISWNRTSILSARTMLLEFRNTFAALDQAVLVFDAPVFAELSFVRDHIDAVRVIDEYVKGYVLMAREIHDAFLRQKKGRLVFVVRSQPAIGTVAVERNTTVSVAESAFVTLAEETAAAFTATANPAMQTLLVRLEAGDDAESVLWLSEQLEQPAAGRNQTRWVKAGARGLFGKL